MADLFSLNSILKKKITLTFTASPKKKLLVSPKRLTPRRPFPWMLLPNILSLPKPGSLLPTRPPSKKEFPDLKNIPDPISCHVFNASDILYRLLTDV